MKPPHQNRPGARSGGGNRRPPNGPSHGGPRSGFHAGKDASPGRPREGREGQDRERPQGERPQGDRFRGARPQSDRPQGERPQGERPRSGRFGAPSPTRAGGGEGPRSGRGGFHAGPRGEAPRSSGSPRGEREFPPRRRPVDRPAERPVERPAERPIRAAAEGHELSLPRPPEEAPPPRPHREPEAPHGSLWIYGQHAVAAALANPARRLRRLLLTEDAETALAAHLSQPWPVPPERVERGRLEHLLGRDIVHQGIALLADKLAPPVLAQALERPGPVLVLDQVSDPRNVGAILRSAQAFGAAAVIVQERNAPDETGALAKAASGALEKVPLLRAVNLARTLVALRAAGCWVVGLDAGGGTLSGVALADRRVALVLGSEGEGLRRLTRETCDEIAGIAMPGAGGGLDSLNVSAATAVALYELGRTTTERQS